jgi:hypothetical protein
MEPTTSRLNHHHHRKQNKTRQQQQTETMPPQPNPELRRQVIAIYKGKKKKKKHTHRHTSLHTERERTSPFPFPRSSSNNPITYIIYAYLELLSLGKDYPQGFDYFRGRLHRAFMANAQLEDEEKIRQGIARAEFVRKGM